ncbi:hypothetical protein Poli38472_006250 [Pythium oligandrum]|uniref:Uncharacterized protein n=1 Tax=Pythium oligandrum TaxID=41045 RepID=A0A8K1CS04_PYTOL|nr:hypothetical protein Poli38472_006250 [Pythium oligandrum]|eukprot:TMW68782.1 hypothetical protein Poli38472_006250 [Pythium oligandrum]
MDSTPSRTPIARRNSFSRETATAIAQLRPHHSFDRLPSDLRLNFPDAATALSPRKTQSFSHLPIVKEDPPLSPLRATHSALNLRVASAEGDEEEEPEEMAMLESPVHNKDDERGHSPTSSSYSPASPTLEDDAFEAWLLPLETTQPVVETVAPLSPPRVVQSNAGDATTEAFTQEVSRWLARDRASTIELSRTMQQIEDDIRQAIGSAAARVSNEMQRRDEFQQELRSAAQLPVDADLSSILVDTVPSVEPQMLEAPVEPELLLLMEVLIGDGRSETIEIYVGDQPDALAAAFAKKHGLVADAIPRLTQHIQDQLDALESEEGAVESQQTQSEEDVMLALLGETSVPNQVDRMAKVQTTMPPPAPTIAELRSQYHDHHLMNHQSTTDHSKERNHEREHNYNALMEKYGHYTSHSGKVNPTHAPLHGHTAPSGAQELHNGDSDPLTMRNLQLAERTRLLFAPRAANRATLQTNKEKDTVFNRLYSLAESREKWIRRQQKIKAAEEMKDQEQQRKLELSSKSREMLANRGNGGYAHIGERLYDEALADMAKKERDRERRAIERENEFNWTCPRCAHVNQHSDEVCRKIVAVNSSGTPTSGIRRESTPLGETPEIICGHRRPEQLFRPTLLSASSSASRAVQFHKDRAASQRRLRSQQAMEDEFRQTCPFKPKINEISEEIMREKLEQEAKSMGIDVTMTSDGDVRRKNPHLALYDDAFHARVQQEAREAAYLKQFPFKPNIGVNALWLSGESEDVVERLAVTKYQELEHKRQSLHEKYAPDRDPVTGKEFFKPETGRAPLFNRNERGLPIGEFLYESHREQAEYHRHLRQQQDKQIKQQRQQSFVSQTSKQALETRKIKTFDRIFDYVRCIARRQTADTSPGRSNGPSQRPSRDSGEQLVVPDDVDIQVLPQEIARIVSIVFEFADHKPITRDSFYSYMEKLMVEIPGLTHTQILFLTNNLADGKSARRPAERCKSEDEDDAELTFRPNIDKNSDMMAKKHGRAEQSNVFQALNKYFDHYRERKDQKKKQLEREFARTHPFQPTFQTKDRKTRGAKFYDRLQQREQAKEQVSDNPLLRTSVPNARPSVRPIDATDEELHSPSQYFAYRSDSFGSLSKQSVSDEEDAALTSHVLAALDDRFPRAPTNSNPSQVASPSVSSVWSVAAGLKKPSENATTLVTPVSSLKGPVKSESLAQASTPEAEDVRGASLTDLAST